jgi:alpha-L-fucosidase
VLAWDAADSRLFVLNGFGGPVCVYGDAAPPAPAPPPLPTPQQLSWFDAEISLMISWDMIAMLPEMPNTQAFCINCGWSGPFPVPPATRWAPSEELFTDSWMEAARAVGAGFTLLVASHCSGFLQWQTNVTLPDGSLYNYSVAQSNWRGGKGDVVADYVASSRAAGLPFGFYLTWNFDYREG